MKDNLINSVEIQNIDHNTNSIRFIPPETQKQKTSENQPRMFPLAELKFNVEECERKIKEQPELIVQYVKSHSIKSYEESKEYSTLVARTLVLKNKIAPALIQCAKNFVNLTDAATLLQYLKHTDNECWCEIQKSLKESKYWESCQYDVTDCAVLYTSETCMLTQCFQWYKDQSFKCVFGLEYKIVELLLNKIRPYYEKNHKLLKANKQDHLKSFMQLREEAHGSPDKHLEDDATQAPGIKARVLSNGIEGMNRVGSFYNGEIVKGQYTTNEIADEAATMLFEANPNLTPGFYLRIMKKFNALIFNKDAVLTKKQINYHGFLEEGISLDLLILMFKPLIKVIEMSKDECPIKNFLTEDALFPKQS